MSHSDTLKEDLLQADVTMAALPSPQGVPATRKQQWRQHGWSCVSDRGAFEPPGLGLWDHGCVGLSLRGGDGSGWLPAWLYPQKTGAPSPEGPHCATWQCGRVWDPWLSASNSRTLSSFKAQAWRADACQVCAARVEEQWPWGVGGKCWGRAQPCGASGSQEGDRGKGPRIKVRRACGILSMLSFLPLPGRRA